MMKKRNMHNYNKQSKIDGTKNKKEERKKKIDKC